MSRSQLLARDLSFVVADDRPDVAAIHDRALEPLGRIERSLLTGPLSAEAEAVVAEAGAAVLEHHRAYAAEAGPQRARARALRTAERVRRTAAALSAVLVVVLVLRGVTAALVLLAVAIAVDIVARHMITIRAARLAADSQRRALRAVERLGEVLAPGEPAGGVAARADALLRRSLAETERPATGRPRPSPQPLHRQGHQGHQGHQDPHAQQGPQDQRLR